MACSVKFKNKASSLYTLRKPVPKVIFLLNVPIISFGKFIFIIVMCTVRLEIYQLMLNYQIFDKTYKFKN